MPHQTPTGYAAPEIIEAPGHPQPGAPTPSAVQPYDQPSSLPRHRNEAASPAEPRYHDAQSFQQPERQQPRSHQPQFQQPQYQQQPQVQQQPQYQQVQQYPSGPQVIVQRTGKEVGLAYIWLIFFGHWGIHQFYLGKTGRGLAYLFTFGYLGVGPLIDLFTLPRQVRTVNADIAAGRR